MNVYNKVGALATRAVGEFPNYNNLRLQNLVESQLEITKTESCLIALSAKFAQKKFSLCASRLGLLIYSLQDEYAWIWGVPVDRCPRQFGSYIATWFALDRSLRNDPAKGLVGRYVATGSFAGRSLRSDRPSGLRPTHSRDGRYVATDRVACSVPQKVRMNELDCVFGSVIHFSRGSCSGAFVESVLRKRSYRNRVSVFVDRRDENLKVEGVQGQTQTRSERGEIGSEGLDSGMDWTYGEEQDVMGKVFIIVFGEREIEKDLRNLDKDDIYPKDKIVSWAMI
ncbi:hypothetical protein F2Q69_00005943 [Brassica cretica]|uniref:Uncharacterized protein n=1 Tax=Brassica cretica TaxID=69181 RepID=A0A8S9P8W0_BRACR|nr:hypothetical protein F2Q69_00005943 [Brassica cretica]